MKQRHCPLCGAWISSAERRNLIFLALRTVMIAAIVLTAVYSAGALTVWLIQS